MKEKDEHAKNPVWKVPMDLPSVKPEDYDVNIDSGRGPAGASNDSVSKGNPNPGTAPIKGAI